MEKQMEYGQEPERECVKVAHPIVDGNESGYVLKYRDEMRADEVEFEPPQAVRRGRPPASRNQQTEE